MYFRLDNEGYNCIKEVEKITLTDYELIADFVSVENLYCMVRDLLHEIDCLNEKISDMEQDIEDNYRPISISEQVGIDYRDFL